MKGKKADDLVKDGIKKLGGMSLGSGPAPEEKHDKKGGKKEEKKKEEEKKEEEEEDMDFGGFF